MKISFCTVSLIKHTEHLEQVFRLMNRTGLKYADVRSTAPFQHVSRMMKHAERKNVLGLAEKYGIRICSLAGSTGSKLASNDEKTREIELAEIKKEIDLAEELGASVIDTGTGLPDNPDPSPELVDRIVPYLREAASYGASKGVKMGSENHGGSFHVYTDKLGEFCEKVGSKNFGVIYEPGNLFGNLRDYRKGFEDQKGHIVHLHLKDGYPFFFRDSSEPRLYCTVYGMGKLDIPWVIRRLKEIDYKGFISIEYEAWHPEYNLPEPEKGIKECFEYLERVISLDAG